MYHVPQISNAAVGHITEGLADVTDKAAHNSTGLDLDSDALQYFAAHVYAVEVAGGGDQCIGEIGHDHDEAHGDDNKDSKDPQDAQGGDKDCHTHADGTVHCEGGDAAQQDAQPTAEAAQPTSSETPQPTSSEAAPAPAPTSEAAAAPAQASDNCHTHDDGTVHCGDHDEPAAPAAQPSAAASDKDCHTHADGTVHCV